MLGFRESGFFTVSPGTEIIVSEFNLGILPKNGLRVRTGLSLGAKVELIPIRLVIAIGREMLGHIVTNKDWNS